MNRNSAAYSNGGYSALAIEIVASGGSITLKYLAKDVTQRMARSNLPKHFRSLYPTGKNAAIHHLNPLFGHPKSIFPKLQRIFGGATTFPTAALPAKIRHAKFNISKVSKARHTFLHKRAFLADITAKVFFNPAMTLGRIANNMFSNSDCED